MKNILLAGLIAVFGIFISSCKKEVSPDLIITVVDTLGAPMENVLAITDPDYDQQLLDPDRVNPTFHKEAHTNAAGQVFFEFPHSSVLDVVAIEAITDTVGGVIDTTAFRTGRTVVRLETKELKKDEKNESSITVVVDSFL